MNANKNLFNKAHEIAHETLNAFANYREAFAAALRTLWAEIKAAAAAAKQAAERAARLAKIQSNARIEKAARWVVETIRRMDTPRTRIVSNIEFWLVSRTLTANERSAARDLALKWMGFAPVN